LFNLSRTIEKELSIVNEFPRNDTLASHTHELKLVPLGLE